MQSSAYEYKVKEVIGLEKYEEQKKLLEGLAKA